MRGAGKGIFPSAGLNGLPGNAAQQNSVWSPFRGANAAYGLAPDNPATLFSVLNGPIATGPPGIFGAFNRDQLARNAGVAFCRMVAQTLSHELAHALGLVAFAGDLTRGAGYLAAQGGIPNARANNFRVGASAGSAAHNGNVIPPGVAGQLLTFAQAAALVVPHNDDLQLMPATSQNFMEDSGSFINVPETFEVGSSGVQANPAFVAPFEPAANFNARNLQQLQAVLPKD